MERRLAAILAADVVGYSRLMGEDETGTLVRLKALRRQLVQPIITAHKGRIVKLMGDGLLAEFPSVVEAVDCATEIQKSIADQDIEPDGDRINLRIGVNLGDIIVEGADIYGDGVNVASRLEGIAEPGGVCISAKVYEEVRRKLSTAFEDLGEKAFKNVPQPVRVYRWSGAVTIPTSGSAEAASGSSDQPFIAVLPFTNMSGDPEQDYFSDGLTEDIITELSKHRWLEVVARNTTFAYKGQSFDIRQLAKAVGANYVVEGSVRRAGQRVRVTVQLIDGNTGNHVWAERYDRKLEDIFDLQDEITQTIVGRIEPEIGHAVRQKVERAPRRDLRAWDCYHLGSANFYKFTAESNLEAQRLFQQSRELDPRFAEAHAWWAWSVILGMVYWDTEPSPALMDEALAAAQDALALDNQSAVIHNIVGRVQLARCEYRSALAHNETAIRLNPTLAAGYCALGDSLCYEGQYQDAIAQFQKAVEMSPNHPQLWAFLSYGALAYLFNHEFDKALAWAEQAYDLPNCQYWATAHAVVALNYLDRPEETRQMVERLRQEQPAFTCAFAKRKLFYLKRPEQLALYIDGLRQAGVSAE